MSEDTAGWSGSPAVPTMHKAAFDKGYAAFCNGLPIRTNPFACSTDWAPLQAVVESVRDLADNWDDGWEEARHDDACRGWGRD